MTGQPESQTAYPGFPQRCQEPSLFPQFAASQVHGKAWMRREKAELETCPLLWAVNVRSDRWTVAPPRLLLMLRFDQLLVFFLSLLFLSFVLLHHFKNSGKGHYFTLLPIWNAGSHYLLPCPKQKAGIGSETETQTQVLHTGSGFPGSGLATRPMPSPCSGVMKILG